jgi:hypothetical protein
VDPVPHPLLFTKSGSAENRTWDLWICSQKLLTTRPKKSIRILKINGQGKDREGENSYK